MKKVKITSYDRIHGIRRNQTVLKSDTGESWLKIKKNFSWTKITFDISILGQNPCISNLVTKFSFISIEHFSSFSAAYFQLLFSQKVLDIQRKIRVKCKWTYFSFDFTYKFQLLSSYIRGLTQNPIVRIGWIAICCCIQLKFECSRCARSRKYDSKIVCASLILYICIWHATHFLLNFDDALNLVSDCRTMRILCKTTLFREQWISVTMCVLHMFVLFYISRKKSMRYMKNRNDSFAKIYLEWTFKPRYMPFHIVIFFT